MLLREFNPVELINVYTLKAGFINYSDIFICGEYLSAASGENGGHQSTKSLRTEPRAHPVLCIKIADGLYLVSLQ